MKNFVLKNKQPLTPTTQINKFCTLKISITNLFFFKFAKTKITKYSVCIKFLGQLVDLGIPFKSASLKVVYLWESYDILRTFLHQLFCRIIIYLQIMIVY